MWVQVGEEASEAASPVHHTSDSAAQPEAASSSGRDGAAATEGPSGVPSLQCCGSLKRRLPCPHLSNDRVRIRVDLHTRTVTDFFDSGDADASYLFIPFPLVGTHKRILCEPRQDEVLVHSIKRWLFRVGPSLLACAAALPRMHMADVLIACRRNSTR